LDSNSLALETRQYVSFDSFKEAFVFAMTEFVRAVRPGRRTRLGLRYVNYITFDDALTPSAWRKLVRPELMGLLSTDEFTDDAFVKHSLGETRLAHEESQTVARYGYLSSSMGFEGADPDVPFFLLDIDHFDVRRFDDISLEQVEQQLVDFHADTYRVFRWSLSPAGSERLGIAAR
jgi:uncharacterized protein (TIGR04255 family)